MGSFSVWHWLIVVVVFGIPGWLIVRALWRVGSKPEPVVIVKETEKNEGGEE
jgi:hypothetical protein